jgi:hypothetical protein
MMSRARTPGMRAHCRARRTHRDLPPDGPVIRTGGLFAAGAGQRGKSRGQAPPELAGSVQRGNQNVPRERSRPAGLKVSLFRRNECVGYARIYTPTGIFARSLASLTVASHGLKHSILSRILTEHAKSGPVLWQSSFRLR